MRIGPTKRRWKLLAIGLASLVAVALIVNGVLAWRAEWRLNSRLAAILAAGDPASIAELRHSQFPMTKTPRQSSSGSSPDSTNSARNMVNSSVHRSVKNTTTHRTGAIRQRPSRLTLFVCISASIRTWSRETGRRGETRSIRLANGFFARASGVSRALIKTQSHVRTAARFLNWRIEVLLADGKREQAVDRGVQVLRLARLYEAEPSMVAFLVAIAMRGQVTQQMYDALPAGRFRPSCIRRWTPSWLDTTIRCAWCAC